MTVYVMLSMNTDAVMLLLSKCLYELKIEKYFKV